jgi:hypothetical protein
LDVPVFFCFLGIGSSPLAVMLFFDLCLFSITAKDEEPSPKKQKKTGNQTSVDTKTEPKSKSTNKYKCQHCTV